MRPTPEQFEKAWPRIVRALAGFTGSLDDAEEYAAEAVARAAAHDGPVDSLAAWCTAVAKRAWIDDHRRRAVEARLAPELAGFDPAAGATADPDTHVDSDPIMSDDLDDRLALLFVACDDALTPGGQMVLALRVVCGLSIPEVAAHLGIAETAAAARLTRSKKTLAQARGRFHLPDRAEQVRRLPVVLDCVAGMFTVAHRKVLDPVDALTDTARQALSIADALVTAFPDETEARGLRAVIRLGLARRPARVSEDGTALALDEVDRSLWDGPLLRAGLADATVAAAGDGRFAIEAAISGLHSHAGSFAKTDWAAVVLLYGALEQRWPSPSVRVARLAARAHGLLAGRDPVTDPTLVGDLTAVERELADLTGHPAAYVRRDATLTLADIEWRSGRRDEAARRYSELAGRLTAEPLRRFCLRRAGG